MLPLVNKFRPVLMVRVSWPVISTCLDRASIHKLKPFAQRLVVVNHAHSLRPHDDSTSRNEDNVGDQKWKILFFGTDHFSLPHLRVLEECRRSGHLISRLEAVVPESKFIKRRGKRRELSPVWDYCQEHNVTCHQWPLTCDLSGYDVGVIVSFGHLLPEWLIKSFPLGILNVHPSLLPRWRGGAPIQHTILHGDNVTGVSIMRILPDKFDVGPLLLQQKCSVPENSTTDSLAEILAKTGSNMLSEVISNLTEYIKNERPQSEEGVTHGLKISSKMACINWETSTDDIDRLYRAIGGQMPLKTQFEGLEMRLEQMMPPSELPDLEVTDVDIPGTISFNKQNNIICVRCMDGWVGFGAISPLGRKKMTAREFYNGYLSSSRADAESGQTRFSTSSTSSDTTVR